MEVVGQIISGNYGSLLVRQKSGQPLELGELLVCENSNSCDILQVFNLKYASQISPEILESVSGMHLEGLHDAEFEDNSLRNYVLADVKSLITIEEGKAKIPKKLPEFFATMRRIQDKDFNFLSRPEYPLFVGNIRSGSKITNIPVFLDGKKVLTHHVLIPATTGRGKSNMLKVMLWNILNYNYAGMLVIDPHNEYYDQSGEGMKYHPKHDKVISYTITGNAKPGQETMQINIKQVKPWHLTGIIEFTDAQVQALYLYYRDSPENWIQNIILGKDIDKGIHETTLPALGRKLSYLFSIDVRDKKVYYEDKIFVENGGENTVGKIIDAIESSKIVILDTSALPGKIELLIGSMVANELFNRYKNYKMLGVLDSKPVASVIIEEAPRVLGHAVGENIYSTIAREGRKFNIGLIAITQLATEIPKHLLANMNTKIILGNEMQAERQQIIASAAHDLTSDDRTIASLEKGEAIISSIFTNFPIPVKMPLFSELAKKSNVKTAVI